MRKTLIIALTGLCIAITASAANRVEERSTKAAPDGRVSIVNVSGSVVVETWEKAEVQCHATLEKDVRELEFTNRNGRTHIKVHIRNRFLGRTKGRAWLVIKVPEASQVAVKTVSADIQVTGRLGGLECSSVSGEMELEGTFPGLTAESISGDIGFQGETSTAVMETVSGEITLQGVIDGLEAESVSGEITAQDVTGRVRAHTISGDIQLAGETEIIRTETVSGDVDVERARATLASLESISGDLTYIGSLAANGELTMDSNSGTLRIVLPETLPASFNITTRSGDIRNDFSKAQAEKPQYGPGASLLFTQDAWNAVVEATTQSGDIRLQKH